ncbi:hypothetical protein WMO40_20745 [Bacillaceae bacterium CLA-AA-H227]|uniref:Uncharacterized protein n=1 Tax=Robertmurraya yapensis (ex Hitch et al 2024) TaxID=3133160 RepID=A0ACC6SGE1_9BACI|nr:MULTISPECIES: hypothetical protein [Bacillaceae]
MYPLETIVLGENVNYYGQLATIVREVYETCWKFVVVINGNRHVLMHY